MAGKSGRFRPSPPRAPETGGYSHERLFSKSTRHPFSRCFFAHRTVATRPLPEAALCVSRFLLNERLAQAFQRLGGESCVGARWTAQFDAGIVRLLCLEVRARDVALDPDLELQFLQAGYVSMCRLPGGELNICGLFRNKAPCWI